MTTITVKDFKQGMDRRRPKSEGVPGSLWDAKNVHITRGGDVESAKKFASLYSVPGTKGMGVARGQVFVFGSANGVTVPAGVQYQRLQAGAATLVTVLDAKPFGGKMYVIARFDDGGVYHFYNGVRLTDWDTISDANADFNVLADYLADFIATESAVDAVSYGSTIVITAKTAGTAFTISASTVNGGTPNDQAITLTTDQANQVAVPETRATAVFSVTAGSAGPGLNSVTSVKAGALELMNAPIDWLTSNAQTAALIAGSINAKTSTGYTASSVGAVVTVSAAAGLGASINFTSLTVTATGTVGAPSSFFTGGVTAVAALPQIVRAAFSGTLETLDKFTITVNGVNYYATPRGAAAGSMIYVRYQRVWCPAANVLRYSKLTDATNWTDASPTSGAGFIPVSNDSQGYDRVIGIVGYDTLNAVMTRQTTNFYTLGTDASQFGLSRVAENSGCKAARSMLSYGNSESFYLDDSGVRSLRAKVSTNAPYVADIGSPIDQFIQEQIRSVGDGAAAAAVSVVEPLDGRFLMAIGPRIYALSYFPLLNIQAWTYYEPGFSVSDFARSKKRLYARAADTIYLYGGVDGNTWPDAGLDRIVETPFLTADQPSAMKDTIGADFSVSNDWVITVAPDPNHPAVFDTIGTVSNVTMGGPNLYYPSREAAWSLKFECTKAGYATISSFAIHYGQEDVK